MDLRKIVLVDDKKAFRQSFKLLLRKVGGSEVVAEYVSGEEFLQSLSGDFCADIIFISFEISGLSGVETVKRALKKKPGLVIIAMSLSGEKIYVDSMINAGARGFLLKFSDNFSILETVVRHPSAEIFYSQEINPGGNLKHSDTIPVLLIDDNESSLFISEYILRNEDFQVIPYHSAVDALNFALKTAAPRLVVTDYLMPEISGMEFSLKLRQIPDYKDVPLLMLSTEVNREIKKKAEKCGIDMVLKKPFHAKDLVTAAETLIFEKKS
ncbi:MAG: response regulator [Bacteroidales bacterium]|nr:response regulator [Bacteroidales bacterium]